jgi:hypothetical protein
MMGAEAVKFNSNREDVDVDVDESRGMATNIGHHLVAKGGKGGE